jgi:hypothetical protein
VRLEELFICCHGKIQNQKNKAASHARSIREKNNKDRYASIAALSKRVDI